MEERVIIEAGSIELEGVFAAPDERPAAGGVVICHPHPQYGGDMDNNVVLALQTAALNADHAALRFNFRGVGGSEGSFDGGMGEREDLKAALSHLRGKLGREAGEIIVSGYSFGAFVASNAALDEGSVGGFILVSPPIDMLDFSPLKNTSLKVLFIAGDGDPFCPLPSLQAFREGMTAENALQTVPGADHFYLGLDGYITRYAEQFLRSSPSH
jgi:hypothetical protein